MEVWNSRAGSRLSLWKMVGCVPDVCGLYWCSVALTVVGWRECDAPVVDGWKWEYVFLCY